jgi:hypothetical protein
LTALAITFTGVSGIIITLPTDIYELTTKIHINIVAPILIGLSGLIQIANVYLNKKSDNSMNAAIKEAKKELIDIQLRTSAVIKTLLQYSINHEIKDTPATESGETFNLGWLDPDIEDNLKYANPSRSGKTEYTKCKELAHAYTVEVNSDVDRPFRALAYQCSDPVQLKELPGKSWELIYDDFSETHTWRINDLTESRHIIELYYCEGFLPKWISYFTHQEDQFRKYQETITFSKLPCINTSIKDVWISTGGSKTEEPLKVGENYLIHAIVTDPLKLLNMPHWGQGRNIVPDDIKQFYANKVEAFLYVNEICLSETDQLFNMDVNTQEKIIQFPFKPSRRGHHTIIIAAVAKYHAALSGGVANEYLHVDVIN